MMRQHPAWGSRNCPEPFVDEDDFDREDPYLTVGELADGTPLCVPFNLAEEVDRLMLSIHRACCDGTRYHTDECPEGPTPDELAAMTHQCEPEWDDDDYRADYETDLWDDLRYEGWAS